MSFEATESLSEAKALPTDEPTSWTSFRLLNKKWDKKYILPYHITALIENIKFTSYYRINEYRKFISYYRVNENIEFMIYYRINKNIELMSNNRINNRSTSATPGISQFF